MASEEDAELLAELAELMGEEGPEGMDLVPEANDADGIDEAALQSELAALLVNASDDEDGDEGEDVKTDVPLKPEPLAKERKRKDERPVLEYNPASELKKIMAGETVDDTEFEAELDELLKEEEPKKEIKKPESPEPKKEIKKPESQEPKKKVKKPKSQEPKRKPEPQREPAEKPHKDIVIPIKQPEKPKVAAPEKPEIYMDEKATPEYDAIFGVFADTFYSFIHGSKTRPVLLEQMQKLAPIVVAGPKGSFPELELMEPKLKAPRLRTYQELCKGPVSVAEDEKTVEGKIQYMARIAEELENDARELLRYRYRQKATEVSRYIGLVRKSMRAMREEPYWVPELAIYSIPVINRDIEPGVIQITVHKILGFVSSEPCTVKVELLGDPDVKQSAQEESREKGRVVEPIVVVTSEAKPPDYVLGWKCKRKINVHDAKVREMLEKGLVKVYIQQKGKREPLGMGVFRATLLARRKDLSVTVPIEVDELPGVTVSLELAMRSPFLLPEFKVKELPIVVAPSVLFQATRKVAQAPMNRTAEQAKGMLRKRGQPTTVPHIYVPTEEEKQMFWSYSVMERWQKTASAVVLKCRGVKIPIQDGVQDMMNFWKAKLEQFEVDKESGKITEESYKRDLAFAIDREAKRMHTLPADVKEEHKGFMALMINELASFEEE